jgi:hypothetical protein
MRTKSLLAPLALFAALAGSSSVALAQGGWFFECIDPQNTQPYSDPYGTISVGNDFIRARIGVVGTVGYGNVDDIPGPCYPELRTLAAPGRFTFGIGPVGSVQTDFDNNLALTTGFPRDPVGSFCYAQIDKGLDSEGAGQRALFGSNGLSGYFVGASQRYWKAFWRDADVDVELTTRVIGDAARMEWRLTNLRAQPAPIGLRFGAYVGMRTGDGRTDSTGANQANSFLGTLSGIPKFTEEGYVGWTVLPTTKPARNPRNYLRTSPKFPDFVNFNFGQTEAYGMGIENTNKRVLDQTPVDQFMIDNFGDGQAPGLLRNNEGGDENWIRTRIFTDYQRGDPLLDPTAPPPLEEADITLSEVAFAQVWAPQVTAGRATRTIVNYIRSTWSTAEYLDPYSVVVDAPRLIASAPGSGLEDLEPNPFRVVAYVDNQYAQLDREIPLSNVRFAITLSPGLRLADGETSQKEIPRIAPNAIGNVEWLVEADGSQVGNLPISVRVSPVPGPSKTIATSVLVSATPRIRLGEGASLVTIPWTFGDSSLDGVLGLQAGRDYVAFKWEPGSNGYTAASSVERGRGLWIVPTSDLGTVALNGASPPNDVPNGGLVFNLRNGWNLIGNPYQYPVPLSQLTAVAEDDPRNSLTWSDLVTRGFVSSSLAFWDRDPDDPLSGLYRYTQGSTDLLQPGRGYWIFVQTFRPIRLSWPPIYLEELPNSGRRPSQDPWRQGPRQWRLQLAARTASGLDSQNFVGVVADATKINEFRVMKPPTAPVARVELAVEDQVNGQPMRLAQAVTDRVARKEWRLNVRSEEPGDVTVTWPNISQVPRNVRFRITDVATGLTRDLRMASGYTVRMAEPGVREFKLSMEPGGATRAVIGNVSVSRAPTRDGIAPFTINYTLSGEAVTSVRILSAAGREVFTVVRARADLAGENTVSWALRDNANRAVAPGAYRVEIVAETVNGERVRRIVPINVTR